jgi:hypothetical protein
VSKHYDIPTFGGAVLKRHGFFTCALDVDICDLQFPVNLASIKQYLMLAGTKVTLNAVIVETFFLLPAL